MELNCTNWMKLQFASLSSRNILKANLTLPSKSVRNTAPPEISTESIANKRYQERDWTAAYCLGLLPNLYFYEEKSQGFQDLISSIIGKLRAIFTKTFYFKYWNKFYDKHHRKINAINTFPSRKNSRSFLIKSSLL